VFAIGGWQKSAAPAFTFKTGDLDYHILKEEPGFRPAPYMAARGMKWIQYYDAACERDDELFYYIQTSHRLASLNLSKKKQKELGLIQ
jgi:predicted DNA-binding protein (MmcQ/YjbR family)